MKIKEYMEDFIRENYTTMSQKDIAKHIGENVTASDIQYWLKKNNLWKRKDMFSDESIKFMIDNYKTMEYSEIAKHIDLTERQVRGKLNNMGYTKNRKFNKNYFNEIDSEIKAYFLGFIYADGWVCHNENRRNYEFGIELQSQDRYIIDYLNDEIGGVHKVIHYEPSKTVINGIVANRGEHDCLRVYSKNIVEDLMLHGVTKNKTYNYAIPLFPKKYFFDFLRGYVDGDGYYHIDKNTINTTKRVNIGIVCASNYVLNWIKENLDKYNIKCHIYKEKELKYRLVIYDKKSVKSLINFMYHDDCSLFLLRKYEKIKHLIKNGSPI